MAEQKKCLVVIDGKSVFYRGYYAMPGLSTKDGVPTGGVYGFATMALEVIKRLKPDYVCVAWDKPKTNIRRRLALYPDYKAGRKPAPADFYAQIPILHELLRAFNWPLYEVDDYEADDIMATLARRAEEQGINTILISSDLDMLQCVSDHTSYFVLKKGLSNIEHYDPKEFEQKYGLKPEQFVDLKSLKGDSSDNIPGVPGIGEKGAIDLLKKYGTLDGVYENLWQISGSLAKKLEAGKDLAYLSRELVVLQTNAPIPFDLEHMDMSNLDARAVEDVLRKLEFRSLLRQLPDVMRRAIEGPDISSGEKAAIKNSGLPHPKLSGNTTSDLPKADSYVVHADYSDSLHRELNRLLIATGDTYVSLDATNSRSRETKQFLQSHELIGYDLKSIIRAIDFQPKAMFDVQIAAFLINPLYRDQSLYGLARDYLELELEAEDMAIDQKLAIELGTISMLHGVFDRELSQDSYQKLRTLFTDIEMPVVPIIAAMERRGIELDPPFFTKMSEKLSDDISDLEQTIYGYAEEEFNISSPQQLAKVLFENLELPTLGMKKGKNGAYSTAADVLDKLRELHPIIDVISQYREMTKLRSTYVEPLPTMIDKDSRLHTTFNMTVAATGRLSSVDPNLQNIPVRTELGREIRKGFVASEGKALVSADYSQFELRLAAVLANDTDMIEAFNSDIDIHTLTASQVFGVALEDVTKDMRYQAKAVNFGILYGQTPHGLAAGTGMTFAEAKEFIDKYFAQRQPLLDYISDTKQQALQRGYVETLFGRRRPTPDVKSSNYMVREAAYRQAINMPVQGTEADLMKLAMIELQKKFDAEKSSAQQLLQIHDSILVECDEGEAKQVGTMMKDVMENIYPQLGIRLKVDVSHGKNWGEL